MKCKRDITRSVATGISIKYIFCFVVYCSQSNLSFNFFLCGEKILKH